MFGSASTPRTGWGLKKRGAEGSYMQLPVLYAVAFWRVFGGTKAFLRLPQMIFLKSTFRSWIFA